MGSTDPRGCQPYSFPVSPSALGKQRCLSNSWAQQWHAGTAVFMLMLMFLPFSGSSSVPCVHMAGQPLLLMQHSICQPWCLQSTRRPELLSGWCKVQYKTLLHTHSYACNQNWGECEKINRHSKLSLIFPWI